MAGGDPRFPEGTMVCLLTGGPMMTVEDTRRAPLVSTVWFSADGICHRDAFHADDLLYVVKPPRERGYLKADSED